MSKDVVDSKSAKIASYRERFQHLQRATDIVRESLREAILDGELAAGSRLREEEIAREFGVSRTPVREALQQLAAAGLVEINPHQGALVSQLSMEDILSLYVVREALEGLAARLAARRATLQQGEELLGLTDEMARMAESGDAAALADLNLRFHAAIRRASGNRHLDRFLSQIELAVRRFGQTTFTYPDRTRSTIAEHRAIVEAIVTRDPERAEMVAIQHMREARQLRLRMLMEDL